MSAPAPAPGPSARPASTAAGYLVVFVIGLVVGIVLVVVSLRALEARKTWQDRYPAAVMQLYQAQIAQLSGKLEAAQCASADTAAHLQTMRSLSNDLEPAFPDLRDHRGFAAHALGIRQALDATIAVPPADCERLRDAIDRIGDSCRACHQDLRS